jgi:DNA-binding LacI/PurR family transcriptional regulator
LTTINQPLVDLGGCAVEALVRLITAEQSDERAVEAESILIAPTLVVRDSATAHLS